MLKAIIIDDEKWARSIIKSFGQWEKYHIKLIGEAKDGLEGFEMFLKEKPDIIITDMQMSNMNGVSLLKKMAEIEDTFKVIVISGHDDFEYMKQAINSKAVEYLLKPLDAKELNDALYKCVNELVDEMDVSNLVTKGFLQDIHMDIMIEQMNELRLALRNSNIDLMNEALKKIEKELVSSQSLLRVKRKVLKVYVGMTIREEIHNDMVESEEIRQLFQDFKTKCAMDLSVEFYINEVKELMDKLFEFRLSSMKKEIKSIAHVAKEYVERNFKEDISLSIIADKFHVTKEYLSSSFKKNYGITLGNYIVELRMKEAARLLHNDVPHKEIANAIGYNDLSYFYRVYRKYYGKTPKDYC